MSDDPFQRPTEHTRPTLETRSFGPPTPADDVDVSIIVNREQGESGIPPVRRPGTIRLHSVIAATVVALLAGIVIGALTIDRPIPSTPITLASFPREVLGFEREDLELRDGNSEAVIKRLDSHFEAQLAGYRFAYGGEGAHFSYGDFTTLTIVNGELAPEVPISDDTEWGSPAVKSLNSKDTKCVSEIGISQAELVDAETGTPLEAVTEYSLVGGLGKPSVWTDCVLRDEQRNLALRLTGRLPGDDAIGAANQFRDELQRIHANLT